MNNIDKIKIIKRSRLKPEEKFIIDHVTDLEEYIHKDYPHSIFYKKDNILLFKWNQVNGYFWCDYKNFWSILELKFNLNTKEICSLVKYMVEEHLIKKDITPSTLLRGREIMVEEHLIKKDITPIQRQTRMQKLVEEHLIKKDIAPSIGTGMVSTAVEEHLIKKDITPVHDSKYPTPLVEEHLIKKDITPKGSSSLKECKVEEHLIKK